MSALFISTATAFGKGSDFYSMSKTLFKKKIMNMIKKSAYPMSSPQHSVGAGVGFDTGKGREGTQELPGRSVTRTKQILKADKNTTEGRDSGAAGQICNTSKTYFKSR